jgi:hypothetical protein
MYDGTNSYSTLAAYKTAVTPRDAASISENPTWLSTSGSDATFLHINNAIAAAIESGGANIASYTDDYDGDSRNATTPDIGADEFDGFTAALVWNGSSSNNWNTAANWTANMIPGATVNVSVSSGPTNMPAINEAPATPAKCRNLTINSGASVTINSGKALTVSGTTTLNGTQCLILKSDATNGTASFIDNGISGTGTAKAERYLSQDKWHYTCFPVTTLQTNPLEDLYVKYYREPEHHFHYIIALDSTLNQRMLGYGIWSDESNATVNFTGTLNTGDISIPVTRTYLDTSVLDQKYSGWNLVGNPYPSAIDLSSSNITWTNVEQAAWFWNQGAGNYKVWPSGGGGAHSQYCPPEQGFFVHCNASVTPPAQGNGSLGVKNSARVHNTETFLKSGEDLPDILRIMATGSLNSYQDELSVYFDDRRSQDYESGYDALKLSGLPEAPQIYTLANNQQLSVNALPFSQKNITVPLGFTISKAGSYSLSASALETFASTISIYLEDLKLSTTRDLRLDPEYAFTYDTLDNPDRFLLHFYNPSFGIEDKKADDHVQIYSFGSSVYIRSTDGTMLSGNAFIYDMTGRELYRGYFGSSLLNRITPGINEGYYAVKAVTKDGVFTRKVYLGR